MHLQKPRKHSFSGFFFLGQSEGNGLAVITAGEKKEISGDGFLDIKKLPRLLFMGGKAYLRQLDELFYLGCAKGSQEGWAAILIWLFGRNRYCRERDPAACGAVVLSEFYYAEKGLRVLLYDLTF